MKGVKLLITTQKVDINDDVLGFFHDWIREFSKHYEQVTVFCLYKGDYDLPDNVRVLSLGKEEGKSRLKYVFNFYKYIWQERKNYNKVFVHMNSVYAVLGAPFWRMGNKFVSLWYTHKAIPLQLLLSEKLVNRIFTASKESFNLPSKKLRVVGHGIDIERFRPLENKEKHEVFKIIYVGRISKIKNQKLLLKAIDILVNKKNFKKIKVDLIGGAVYEREKKYLKELEGFVNETNLGEYINFIGSVPNQKIVKFYQDSDLAINLCPTGGMDKAVLEAMACGLPVVVLNKTFVHILSDHKDLMLLKEEDVLELVKKIIEIRETFPKELSLRKKVVIDFSLKNLITKIC